MTAVSICLALGNAARSAEKCASMCREAKKEAQAVAQDRHAAETWKIAGWWADMLGGESAENGGNGS